MSRPLPRFTDQAIPHDPISILIAQRESERARAQARISSGNHTPADPADLRGIPCIARGVGGTSPGTNPAVEVTRLDNVRPVRHHQECA